MITWIKRRIPNPPCLTIYWGLTFNGWSPNFCLTPIGVPMDSWVCLTYHFTLISLWNKPQHQYQIPDLKGLLAKKIYWLKRCHFCPLSACHRWKIWQLPIKNRKMHFCQIFGLSKLLTGRENGSPKKHYRMAIWLSKALTRHEFGSQNHLLDENLAIKYSYRI